MTTTVTTTVTTTAPTKYLSVCSGIEAATVAWEPLGWEAVGFSEIEAFPCAVLAHHYPHVPLHGDFTALIEDPPLCDVLVGGTPCQAFSVAGARRSLDDARGNLSLAYVELANAIDRKNHDDGREACITVWENVPGVFSTKDNAFGCFLRGLAGSVSDEDGPLEPPGGRWSHCGVVLGPQRAIAWRVLDAQYFGLAQRRRRVFVVASAREGFDPSEVLLEWEGVRRDSAPSREARQEAPAPLGGRVAERDGGVAGIVEGVRAFPSQEVVSSLTASGRGVERTGESRGQDPLVVHVEGVQAHAEPEPAAHPIGFRIHSENSNAIRGNGNADVAKHVEVTRCLDTTGGYAPSQGGTVVLSPEPAVLAVALRGRAGGNTAELGGEIQPALRTGGGGGSDKPHVLAHMVVRRLTPRECERLQGFPDDYTIVPWRGKPCPDGPRYKALGNSMAVPVMRWIGRRIDEKLKENK